MKKHFLSWLQKVWKSSGSPQTGSQTTSQTGPSKLSSFSSNPETFTDPHADRLKKLREEVSKFVSNEETCFLFKDFYEKAISSPAGDLTFAKWVATLGTVDLHTLDRLFLELTCPPLARAPGMLETFGAGSKSAAALLFLGVALENSKIESLSQMPLLATRASINAVAFIKIAFLSKTGIEVELKTEKALLTTTPSVDEILGGPYASQRKSSLVKKEDIKEYSEHERGVGDEAFQDLMKKVLGGRV